MESASKPYPAEPGPIGATRDGVRVALAAMTPAAAATLGTGLACIDPWARLDYSPERFTNFFAATGDSAQRYQIRLDEQLVGAMVVRNPWLSGPYLNILGLLPGSGGRGIGHLALGWFEAEARRAGYRNVWLCVSSFNSGAERFYRAHGFERTATLDNLAFAGFDEFLMRKRLASS